MTIDELKQVIKENNYEINEYINFEKIYVNKFLNSFRRYFITYEEINGIAFLTDKGETHETLTAIDKNIFIEACNKYNLNFTKNVISKRFESILDLEAFISALDDISAPGHKKYEEALKILQEKYKTNAHGYNINYIKINKELSFGTFYSILLVNHQGYPIITDWADTVYYLHKLDTKVFEEVCKKHDVHFEQGTMERKFNSNEDVKIFISAIDELVKIAKSLEDN